MALRTMFQKAVKLNVSSVPSVSVNSVRAFNYRFVNQVTLLGRVGREPQRVGVNDAVAFPFYTESTTKLKDGTSKTYPCWHKVLVARKNLANAVFSSVERGQRCYISGRLAYRAPTEGPDGKLTHHHQAAIVVDDIIFLEKSRKGTLSENSSEHSSNVPKEVAESFN